MLRKHPQAFQQVSRTLYTFVTTMIGVTSWRLPARSIFPFSPRPNTRCSSSGTARGMGIVSPTYSRFQSSNGMRCFLHPSQRHHRSHPRTFYDAAVWDWGMGLHRIREEEKNPEVKQRRTLWNTYCSLLIPTALIVTMPLLAHAISADLFMPLARRRGAHTTITP